MNERLEQEGGRSAVFAGVCREPSPRRRHLAERFEALARLRDGWFDGLGKAPDREALRNAARLLVDAFPESLPLPAVVPTQDGNVLLEWSTAGMPSVDLDLATMTAAFHAFGERGEDIEQDFLLTDAQDIDDFFALLVSLIHFGAASDKECRKLAKRLKAAALPPTRNRHISCLFI